MYKNILLIILFIGILFVSIDYTKMNAECTRTKIIYKYIPRTFREEQESPVSVSELFADMFEKSTPWVGGFTMDKTTRTDINKYFASQV